MTRASVSVRYLLQEMALIVAFVLLFLFANTWRVLADYNTIQAGVYVLALAAIACVWLRLRSRSQATPPLIGAIVVFLGAYAVAALASIDPRRSFDEVWVAAMYCFVFLCAAQLVALGWPRELFVKALLIAGAVLAGIAWWLAGNWYSGWLSAMPGVWVPAIAFRLPLANGTATFLNLLCLAAIARLAGTRGWAPRVLLGAWILSALGLSYLTASRGGWLGLAAGLACLAALGVIRAGGWSVVWSWWKWIRRRWLVGLAGLALATLVGTGIGMLAMRQIKNPTKTNAQDARTEFWVPAWRVFTEKPILGQGPLTFGSAYLRINSVPPYGFFPHAHSIPFNLLAETGLVGTLAFGVLAAAAFAGLGRQLRLFQGQDYAVVAGVFAGAVAWAAHSLVDSVNVEPMNSATFAVLLGVALAPAAQTATGRRVWQIAQAWTPAALGCLLTVTGFLSLWRLTPLHEGVLASTHSDWQAARTSWQTLTERDPASAVAHLELGLAESTLASQGNVAARDAAITQFETVVRLDPDWWLHHANLAALYADRQDLTGALAQMRQAIRLGPGSALLQLDYGQVAERAGSLDEAEQAYRAALQLRPDWARAYFWRQTSLRAAVVARWSEAGGNVSAPSLTDLERQGLGGDRVRDYTPFIDAYLQAGRLTDAAHVLQLAKLAYADTGEDRLELTWLEADLDARRGQLETAAQLGQAAINGYQYQSVFGPGAFGSAPYTVNFFRQESAAADLVPQLPEVPLTDKWADRWVQLGDWYKLLGRDGDARQAYQAVLSLVPDNDAALSRHK